MCYHPVTLFLRWVVVNGDDDDVNKIIKLWSKWSGSGLCILRGEKDCLAPKEQSQTEIVVSGKKGIISVKEDIFDGFLSRWQPEGSSEQ